MLAAADAANCLLVINHNRRWEHTPRRLQAAIAAGELGELTAAEVTTRPAHSRRLAGLQCLT